MILVSVGNPTQPFDRLLRLVDAALTEEEAARTVWQVGASAFRPRAGKIFAVIPPPDFHSLLLQAETFICHAGEGSVMESLQAGKLPIVCARRKRFREHVNDHQLELVEEMAKRGLALVAESTEDIRRALAVVREGAKPNTEGWDLPRIQPVIAELLQAAMEKDE